MKNHLTLLFFLLVSFTAFGDNMQTRSYTTTTTTTTTTIRRSNKFLYTDRPYDTNNSYRGFLNFGFDISGNNAWPTNFILRTTHGYQSSQNFFIGIGGGLDFPMGQKDHTPNVPLYGTLRFQGNQKHLRFVPMIDLRVGYCFNNLFSENAITYKDYVKGGLYINPALGFTYVLNPWLGINLAVGYSFYKYKKDEPDNGLWFKNRQGITIELGLEF